MQGGALPDEATAALATQPTVGVMMILYIYCLEVVMMFMFVNTCVFDLAIRI